MGFFWGFWEDHEIKAAQEPLKSFAWFQILLIEKETTSKGTDQYFVSRGTAKLMYGKQGGVHISPTLGHREPITLIPPRPIRMEIEVDHNRLVSVGKSNIFSDKSLTPA